MSSLGMGCPLRPYSTPATVTTGIKADMVCELCKQRRRCATVALNIPSLDSHRSAMPFSGYHPLHPMVLR
jgi:hypothetical protein